MNGAEEKRYNQISMKKITTLVGFSVLLLNAIVFLILSNYNPFNFTLSSITIFSTWLLITLSAKTSPNNGFKIGLTFFFSLTFFVKLTLALISNSVIKDNPVLVILACVTLLEFILLFLPNILRKN